MGNPPYSVSSSNKSDWIEDLMNDYKEGLNERNIQPLSDDYLKFLRFGQYFICKNGEGILAYISNNSFIDGLIHKKVRESLLESYDQIYVLDLHGNLKRKEKTPTGGKDENVFDIQPGVSINIFIKNEISNSDRAKLFKYDLYGKRDKKYDFLNKKSLASIEWEIVKEFDEQLSFKTYTQSALDSSNSFKVDDLFNTCASGITTERDTLTIQYEKKTLKTIKSDFSNSSDDHYLRKKYDIGSDGRDWKLKTAKEDLVSNNPQITKILYRPFDYRFTLYTGNSKGFHSYPRSKIMDHLIGNDNLALVIGRQGQAMGNNEWSIISISKSLTDCNIYYRGRGTVMPLYLYPEEGGQQTLDGRPERRPNLNMDIVQEIANGLGLRFVPEKKKEDHAMRSGAPHAENNNLKEKTSSIRRSAADEKGVTEKNTFAPIDLLDYIYAVLHSPSYREKYKEFLKIDFPRVPYPTEAKTFWQLVKLGGELRQIHLLEHPIVDDFITTYPKPGSNKITKRLTKTQPGFIPLTHKNDEPETTGPDHRYPNEPLGNIQINKKQYFGQVPEKAWNFYIGGYQPAEKWLKDRRDRKLSVDEIKHYQKIIVALMETDRIMQQIDAISIEE